MKQVPALIHKCFKIKYIFTLCAVVLCIYNLKTLSDQLVALGNDRAKKPYTDFGIYYAGLKTFLADTEIVGFLSDKDLDNPLEAMEFAHAQYALAPVILDFNNADYHYLLLDYKNPLTAFLKINEFSGTPVAGSPLGNVLITNPNIIKQW